MPAGVCGPAPLRRASNLMCQCAHMCSSGGTVTPSLRSPLVRPSSRTGARCPRCWQTGARPVSSKTKSGRLPAFGELLKSQVSAAPALCLSHTVLTLCLRTRLVTAPHPLALRCAACYHMQAITCTTPDHSIAARSCIYVLHSCIVASARMSSVDGYVLVYGVDVPAEVAPGMAPVVRRGAASERRHCVLWLCEAIPATITVHRACCK